MLVVTKQSFVDQILITQLIKQKNSYVSLCVSFFLHLKFSESEEVQNDEFTFRSILQFFHGVLQPLQFWVERPENTVNKFLIEVRSGDAFSV